MDVVGVPSQLDLLRLFGGGRDGSDAKTTTLPTASAEACAGWDEYKKAYPNRSEWLMSRVADIRKHEICRTQWPEAFCDYTTAGILFESKGTPYESILSARAGKLELKNHIWLYDKEAKVNIDFTAHQFPLSQPSLSPYLPDQDNG